MVRNKNTVATPHVPTLKSHKGSPICPKPRVPNTNNALSKRARATNSVTPVDGVKSGFPSRVGMTAFPLRRLLNAQ